ncbi:helix-turn-helix transcriptional regulator [uncultured Clostridium sp.]|uniref:helix-turn-helix transcriptional regulator n=1 Tax=uncultured Clostridium sp. TaxID=59620 RepID=UPI00280BCD58|nr:helix-turn-helix transcriptional regulator [uncultured Clostridium sp.]
MRNYDLKKIGNNLRILRTNNSWKFSYVSKKTEIEENRLRNLEKGIVVPNHFELYNLSRLFGVSIDDIVYRDLK